VAEKMGDGVSSRGSLRVMVIKGKTHRSGNGGNNKIMCMTSIYQVICTSR